MVTAGCRFAWCETDANQHAEDPSYHTRELGFGMLLTVDNEGQPITNWMPDWQEWWIDKPDEIDTEYTSVAEMLRGLRANFTAFREALTSDPQYAAEVEAMKVKEGLS